MDDKPNGVVPAVDDEDLNTTAPNPEPKVWKMPEPVFRKTSGHLPQSFERESFFGSETQEHVKPDALHESDPTPQLEPAPKSPTLKIILVVLGLAAMIAFIAVFLSVIYFFFLR